MKIKSLLLSGMLMLAATLSFSQSSEDQPFVSKSFKNKSLNALAVETSGGSIIVKGAQKEDFVVDMFVRPNNWNGKNQLTKEEIEDRLEDYDILIGTEGSKVVATAKRKNGTKWDNHKAVSISFKITTPRSISTNLRTSGGSIRITSLSGEQNFATSGGSLNLDDLDGTVIGKTSGGSIEVSNCRNVIELTTSGGSIRANDLHGKVKLTTSGGSIALLKLEGDIVAHTSGGSVKGDDIKGTLDAGTSGGSVKLANISGSLKASTSAGSVEVAMAKLGQYLDLRSSAGSIRVSMPLESGLDLNLKGNKVSIPLKNFDGNVEKNKVNGKMNGGGIPVTLSASSGSVYVNQ